MRTRTQTNKRTNAQTHAHTQIAYAHARTHARTHAHAHTQETHLRQGKKAARMLLASERHAKVMGYWIAHARAHGRWACVRWVGAAVHCSEATGDIPAQIYGVAQIYGAGVPGHC